MDVDMALQNKERKHFAENNLENHIWCSTEVKFSKLSFMWTIHNFSFCDEKMGEFLKSSTFCDGDYDEIKWYLKLYPKRKSEEVKDYLSIYLNLVTCDKSEVRAKSKFSILNSKREQINVIGSNSSPYTYNPERGWGYGKFLKQSILEDNKVELLPDDKLTICCEIIIKTDVVNSSCPNDSEEFKIPESHYLENLKNLFESQEFSDIILVVKGKEFHAHKVILAAHSQVFSAMFKHEMEKKRQNRVEIIDIEPDIFEEMLYFIYTGKSRNLENMASDLLIAADKYALENLKIMCEQEMFSEMTIKTASDDLIIADIYNAEQLKKHAIDFINAHSAKVVETIGWKNIISKYPHLIIELYHASAKQQIP